MSNFVYNKVMEDNALLKNAESLSYANFPITYFYEQFNLRNNLQFFQTAHRQEKTNGNQLLYQFVEKLYQRKYTQNPLKHLNGAWLAFLKAKEIIIQENKSLYDVYLEADKYNISRDDLNNVGYLAVSNLLNSIVNLKENLFAFIDWDKLENDQDYQKNKETYVERR